MGAAIPHLLTLSVSLPAILPFARDDIQLEVRTGSIEVLDEVIPDDEDEDISVRTREKGSVSVILKIQDGKDPVGANNSRPAEGSVGKGKHKEVIVVQELEQEDEEMN
jgi:ribonuclease P/MRP protein subunit RPP20